MRWLSIICALIGLTSICGAAPTGSQITTERLLEEPTSPDTTSSSSSSSSSSLSSARKLPTHDVGLPSELAWQAWLIVANKPDAESSFESATVPRRISPKSVFVAPKLDPECSDGYKFDSMGRCVKETIQINYKTHLEFILERLRAKFPSNVELDDSAATGPEQKEFAASGPLQVNISLGIEDNLSASKSPLSSEKTEREVEHSDGSAEFSVVQVPRVEALSSDRKPTMTEYEVGNGTETEGEKEKTFFRGNSSQPFGDHSIREVVVPVAEFVDDGNQTFTEVIDYEIPSSLGQLFNVSNAKPLPLAKNVTETKNVDDAPQPTVVLLLSSTKLTGTSSTPYFKDADSRPGISTDHGLAGTENLADNSTVTDEINIAEQNSQSEDTIAEEDEEVTLPDDGSEETTLSEVPETVATTSNPEEDPEDATEWNDEILTHGEAGMLVSAGKFVPSTQPDESSGPSASNKTIEDTDGNISSESSITGDVIVETTLLDLNTGTTPTRGKLDDLRELFEAEKEIDLEPEVVFSPQDARRLDRFSTRGKERPGDVGISSSTSKEPFLINLGDSSTLDSSPQDTMAYTSRHKDHRESDEGILGSERNHPQQRRRTTSNQDHVRFPDDSRQPSSSYVHFPSDHSNSINGNLNYKERSSFVDDNTGPQSVPKSSVPLHQKKTYWQLPPGWRIDDLQPPRQPVAVQNGNKRQNQMLFRFWTRMPLFRDPSLTMSNQSSRVSQIVNQRDSIYRSISPQAVNPVFTQTARGGGQVIG